MVSSIMRELKKMSLESDRIEKTLGLRRCFGWRSGGQAKMVRNFNDCAGFQDGCDDFQGSTAMRASTQCQYRTPVLANVPS